MEGGKRVYKLGKGNFDVAAESMGWEEASGGVELVIAAGTFDPGRLHEVRHRISMTQSGNSYLFMDSSSPK